MMALTLSTVLKNGFQQSVSRVPGADPAHIHARNCAALIQGSAVQRWPSRLRKVADFDAVNVGDKAFARLREKTALQCSHVQGADKGSPIHA